MIKPIGELLFIFKQIDEDIKKYYCDIPTNVIIRRNSSRDGKNI